MSDQPENKKELVKEHERLVDVLKSPSHEDDKKEAKTQEKELEGYKADEKESDEDLVDYQFAPEESDSAPKEEIKNLLGHSLQNIKAKLPELAQIKESNPEAYQSMVEIVNSVKEMVKAYLGNDSEDKPEETE